MKNMRRGKDCVWNTNILDFQISQGNVATQLRWGGSIYIKSIKKFLWNLTVKELRKSVFICQKTKWQFFSGTRCMPICIVFGVVSCQIWRKSRKYRKTCFVGSKSFNFKIVVLVINRKGICDFLLVVYSNLGRISHGFGTTATYWSKSHLWDLPLSHLTPIARDDPLANVSMNLTLPKRESMWYLPVKTTSSYVHSFWHSTGMWWTDRWTEML